MNTIFSKRQTRLRDEFFSVIFNKISENVSSENPTGKTPVDVMINFWLGTGTPVIDKIRFGDEEEDETISISKDNLEYHYADYPDDEWFSLLDLNSDDLSDIADCLDCKPEFYHIDALAPEDVEMRGFDTKKATSEMFQKLAEKLSDDYHEQLFWSSLDILAEYIGFEKKEKTDIETQKKEN